MDREGIIDDAPIAEEEIAVCFEDGAAAELTTFVRGLPVGRITPGRAGQPAKARRRFRGK